MKKNRVRKSTGFVTAGILMLAAGFGAIIVGIMAASVKLNDGDAAKSMVLLAMIITIVYGIAEIVTGFASLCKKPGSINPAKCVTLGRIIIILCFIQIIISGFNGIYAGYLIALVIIGIIIPLIYLIASARGRIKRPGREIKREVRR